MSLKIADTKGMTLFGLCLGKQLHLDLFQNMYFVFDNPHPKNYNTQ